MKPLPVNMPAAAFPQATTPDGVRNFSGTPTHVESLLSHVIINQSNIVQITVALPVCSSMSRDASLTSRYRRDRLDKYEHDKKFVPWMEVIIA